MPRISLPGLIFLALASLFLLGPYVGIHIITTPLRNEGSGGTPVYEKAINRGNEPVDEIEDLLSK